MDISIRNASVTGRDGAIPFRDYLPATQTAPTPFLWVHGGGFTSGGLDQRESDAPARALAASGRWVRTIDYRRAPKVSLWGKLDLSEKPGRFPAAHHDVLDVAAALRADSGGPIAMGGASAGADLAAGAALAMRDAGEPALAAMVLAYGTLHASLPERDDVERALTGPLAKWAFNPKMTRRMNLNYVGDESLLVPGYAFPGGADLHDFPPTLLLNSRNDRLRKSGDAFADELRDAHVEVDNEVLEGIHGFLGATRSGAYSAGLQLITEWLAAHEKAVTA
jgi:acetyl esterase/lipase